MESRPDDLPLTETARLVARAWADPSGPGASVVPASPAGPVVLRHCWQKRRFWCLGAGALLAAAAVAAAWTRGQQTRVVFINAGETSLPPFTVAASGRSHTIPEMEPDGSFRWVLEPGGQTSSVRLHGLLGDGSPWSWEGESLTPGDGRRLVLRITPDGGVEPSESLSVWRQIAGD